MLEIADFLLAAEQALGIDATPEEINRTFRAVAAKRMTEDYFTIWMQEKTRPPLGQSTGEQTA